MRWSLRIGQVAGIAIFVHISFLLLPLWIGFTHYSVRQSWIDAGSGVLFLLILFAIVVLHELGHALTARRFGIQTRDITLLPIGGVARLERLPEDPKQELLVALAGPAVNVGLALLLFALVGASAELSSLAHIGIPGDEFLVTLLWLNVALAVFNLIPAFPMDGGRVLRAILALRMSYVRATNLAAGVGQTLAFGFAFVGLSSIFFGHLGPVSNPFLLFIALFVWMGASHEAGLVQMKSALGNVPVARLMVTDFRTLAPDDSLSRAVEHLLGGWQHDFPVLEQGRVAGVLTRSALVHGLAQRGQNGLVRDVMLREVSAIEPGETTENVLLRLSACEQQILLVVQDERLSGILTKDNLQDFLLIRAALNGERLQAAA
jgi:Zn-dependent protease/CBS domain-containing protein